MNKTYAKIIFEYTIKLETGLHIGGSKEFSAIGAIDSPVMRDTLTQEPYIPGSSLKGKMRYLLARAESETPLLKPLEQEDDEIKRLFGSSVKNNIVLSRLQFSDCFLTQKSAENLEERAEDAYMTEIKFENNIDRITSKATPRQIERVPRGAEFDFTLSYNVENIDEFEKDLENIKKCITLLKYDYLGGSGTRGYGRVSINLKTRPSSIESYTITEEEKEKIEKITEQVFSTPSQNN